MSSRCLAVIGFKEENTPQRLVAYSYDNAITTIMNSLSSKEYPFTPEVKCSFTVHSGGCLVDLFQAYRYLLDSALPDSGFTKLNNDWWAAPDDKSSVVSKTHGLLQTIASVGDMEVKRKNGGCI